jgi:ABC-type amino acid transport substrate-binding protein
MEFRSPNRRSSTFSLVAPIMLLGAVLLALCSPVQARQVVLATTAWEPYIGPNLPGQGYVAEVAREALARSGHSLRLVFLPWARAVHMAQHCQVDGYLPEYESLDLRQTFLFSAPFPGGPVGFFKRRDRPAVIWRDLDGLKPYRIGVVRGYVNAPEFDARTDLRKQYVNNDETNLRMLLAGRIDLMLADEHVGYALARKISRETAADIEFLLPPLEDKDLFVCFPAHLPESCKLQEAFNHGLEELRRDGTLDRLRARHGLR